MQPPVSPHVITLDLNFLGNPGAIAAYLIPHSAGAALIECGPGSTLKNLQKELSINGYTPADISDVLLTHIHLDHAGAAGWLARQGARIHVHEIGAPHMINPDRLLSSAGRIYGGQMELLWGEFLPVPQEKIAILRDNAEIEIAGRCFQAIDTPGHAYHHMAYRFEDILFTGDIGGIRLQGTNHLRLPMPPPEFHLEKWRESLERLSRESKGVRRIAPTHFGVFDDPGWHFDALRRLLEDVANWIDKVMPGDPSLETLNEQFMAWTQARTAKDHLAPETIEAIEAANPSWMSPLGIQRYWRKFRQPAA